MLTITRHMHRSCNRIPGLERVQMQNQCRTPSPPVGLVEGQWSMDLMKDFRAKPMPSGGFKVQVIIVTMSRKMCSPSRTRVRCRVFDGLIQTRAGHAGSTSSGRTFSNRGKGRGEADLGLDVAGGLQNRHHMHSAFAPLGVEQPLVHPVSS